MTNELILDVTECIGALSADIVDFVEDTRLNVQSGSSAGSLELLAMRSRGNRG